MERIPIDDRTELHEVVAGVYDAVFDDDLDPDGIDLYAIESEHVEAEIHMPAIGINRSDWETEWSPERRLEVLLHEFAHVEEAPGEPDHGPAFYDRLAGLTRSAAANRDRLEALFGAPLDFEAVRGHILDSVNEYTIEADADTVEARRAALRESLPSTSRAQ